MVVCRGQEEVAVRVRVVICSHCAYFECLGYNYSLGSHEEEWTWKCVG